MFLYVNRILSSSISCSQNHCVPVGLVSLDVPLGHAQGTQKILLFCCCTENSGKEESPEGTNVMI